MVYTLEPFILTTVHLYCSTPLALVAMLNDHSKASIGQIVFYVPALALVIALRIRHGRPQMAWAILILFCMSQSSNSGSRIHLSDFTVRIACGIVVILHEKNPSAVGLIIASLILLNAGVFPLIAATLGFVRIVYVIKPWGSLWKFINYH